MYQTTRNNWKQYWFTLLHSDGPARVKHIPGKIFPNCCFQDNDRFGGGNVMAWIRIIWGKNLVSVDDMLNAVRQRTTIVITLPDLAGFTYQQDNARPHRARTLVAHFVHQTTRFESHRHLEETERSQKNRTTLTFFRQIL